jgi:DNA-binding protein HU-beta
MNKKELIANIAELAELSTQESERAVNAFTDTITRELAKGGSISLIGFGTFQIKERAERTGRNPQTGEAITISASKNPGFKAGKTLKDALK